MKITIIKLKTGITMKPNSIKPAHHRRQSAAGRIRLQRIYPSSAPRRTCIVSDSGGHQSASGGSAAGSASGTPARNSTSSPRFSPLSYLLSPRIHLTLSPTIRRQHCSSYTYSTGKGLDACNPYIPNEPNLNTNPRTVTLDIIRTYNAN